MRGEESKRAVQEISKHAYYATTGSACERALKADTPEAYRQALHEITTSPNRGGEYAVNIDRAESALRNDR
jgi:hypothetical protein